MGWSIVPVNFASKDTEEIKDFLIFEWEGSGYYKVREYSKKGNTIYMAVERLDNNEIFAVVTKISFQDGEFHWKTIDETMGPVEAECPQKILKKLSPTNNKYALEWRERCWEYHMKNKASRSKFKNGDILEFPYEITFTNGFSGKKFILIKEGRSYYFAHFNGQKTLNNVYPEFRIRRWRERDPKIIGRVGDYKEMNITENTLLYHLPKRVQEEIEKDLSFVGISMDNMINVKLGDLKAFIDISNYLSK